MTDLRIAPNSFLAQDAGYPGLSDLPAQLFFPAPLTLQDYLTWERTAFPVGAEPAATGETNGE